MRILYLHARATNQFIKEPLSVSLYVVLSSTLISLSLSLSIVFSSTLISLSLSLVRLGFCLTSFSLNVKAQSVSQSLSVCLFLHTCNSNHSGESEYSKSMQRSEKESTHSSDVHRSLIELDGWIIHGHASCTDATTVDLEANL